MASVERELNYSRLGRETDIDILELTDWLLEGWQSGEEIENINRRAHAAGRLLGIEGEAGEQAQLMNDSADYLAKSPDPTISSIGLHVLNIINNYKE